MFAFLQYNGLDDESGVTYVKENRGEKIIQNTPQNTAEGN